MDRIEALNNFLKENPHDSFVQHALAMEYIKRKDDAEARRILEALLERDASYVGSYYHLGKLLERAGERAPALAWYEKGMAKARESGDRHAYSELQAAHEDLEEADS